MSAEASGYSFRIVFEAGSGLCLWSANDAARLRFGHAVDLDLLPLDWSIRAQMADLAARCEAVLPVDAAEPGSLSGHTLFGYEPAAAAFATEVSALAVGLREGLGLGFHIAHDFEAPAEDLQVGWNRRWISRAAVSSLAMAVLTGWFAYAIGLDGLGVDLSASGRLMLAAMFLTFAALCMGTAVTYGLALAGRGVVLTLDAAGLHDRRLTRRPIPWPAITAVIPLQRGGQLMLALQVEDARKLPGPRHPLWALNRASARLTRGADLAVNVASLDISPQTLMHATLGRSG